MYIYYICMLLFSYTFSLDKYTYSFTYLPRIIYCIRCCNIYTRKAKEKYYT